MGGVNSSYEHFHERADAYKDTYQALDPGSDARYELETGRETVSDGEAPPEDRNTVSDGEAPPEDRNTVSDGEAPPEDRNTVSDGEAPEDRNKSDYSITTTDDECNHTAGLRLHEDDTVQLRSVSASEKESNGLDGVWNIFSQIKGSLRQFGGRRSPGIYDDRKTVQTTINFNNNEYHNDVNILYSDGLTPLTKAVRAGNVPQVEAILTHPDVNVDLREDIPPTVLSNYREPSRTALIVAIQAGQTEIVKRLLQAGADVNITDGDLYSPLFHAANEDYCDIVKLLLQFGASVESVNSYQDPLYTACRHGNTDIVDCLLTAGFAVNRSTDMDQPSVLSAAMESSSEEVCLKLLRKGANVITGNKTTEPFIAACQYGHPLVVSACIKAGCDPDMKLSNNLCPIQAAIKLCNFQTDRAILYGTSMTYPHALSSRAKEIFEKRMFIVELLCNNGCSLNEDINIDSVSVLAKAIQLDNLPCAYILLRHGAKWDLKCHAYLVKAHDNLTKQMSNFSDINLMQSIFIPKIINTLSHTERAAFHRETTLPPSVPNLKDCCRHAIRRQFKQQTNKSILPQMSALHLPNLLHMYLCYNDSGEIYNVLL